MNPHNYHSDYGRDLFRVVRMRCASALVAGRTGGDGGGEQSDLAGVLKCAHRMARGPLPNPVETVESTCNGRTYLVSGYTKTAALHTTHGHQSPHLRPACGHTHTGLRHRDTRHLRDRDA